MDVGLKMTLVGSALATPTGEWWIPRVVIKLGAELVPLPFLRVTERTKWEEDLRNGLLDKSDGAWLLGGAKSGHGHAMLRIH